MKYLKMFDSVVGLFPKTIKVTLIDVNTGNSLGVYKMALEQLPAAFNKPTTIELNQINWRVFNAKPVLADDFAFTKKLTLVVQNVAQIDERLLHFNLPTVCRELPITGTDYLFNEFNLELSEHNWQQIEFQPLHQASVIEQEINHINHILAIQPNPLLGYERQYIREATTTSLLTIPFHEFCEHVKKVEAGNIILNKTGFVKNGFALRSESYTWYGIVENELIQTLCITQFNYVDDEFMLIVNKYDLLLVDWCNANMLSIVASEGEEKPIKL